jgi:hypothetical protein
MTAIDKIFQEYLDKGYIEEVTDETDVNRSYSQYINHFPVVHAERDTTKSQSCLRRNLIQQRRKILK